LLLCSPKSVENKKKERIDSAVYVCVEGKAEEKKEEEQEIRKSMLCR